MKPLSPALPSGGTVNGAAWGTRGLTVLLARNGDAKARILSRWQRGLAAPIQPSPSNGCGTPALHALIIEPHDLGAGSAAGESGHANGTARTEPPERTARQAIERLRACAATLLGDDGRSGRIAALTAAAKSSASTRAARFARLCRKCVSRSRPMCLSSRAAASAPSIAAQSTIARSSGSAQAKPVSKRLRSRICAPASTTIASTSSAISAVSMRSIRSATRRAASLTSIRRALRPAPRRAPSEAPD